MNITPGTWETEPFPYGYIGENLSPMNATRIYSRDPGPHDSHIVGYAVHVDRTTREANARLFSAAPELYDALKGAIEELRLIRMKDSNACYDPTIRLRADIAIAKAEGKL